MERKDYWDKEYVKYWMKMTEEAEEGGVYSNIKKLSGKDFKTGDIQMAISYFDWLLYKPDDKVLDYGCGFGRFYPYFSDKCKYYGIDISQAMIDACVERYPEAIEYFQVSEGEALPFEDSFFDKIVCYGVFDACYQEQALAEMLRVIKKGGCLLISGKSDNYFLDDEEAYIAEVNARKKGHPNYFTDVPFLVKQLGENCTIIRENYALRRGDMAMKICQDTMPSKFYEWIIAVRKDSDHVPEFEKFSDAYSKTFRERNV